MNDVTPRFGLPLLAAGQAQKEVFHNEAVTLLDVLAQPVAQTLGDDAPPAAPTAGQAWIAGDAPTGAWAGQGGTVALYTAGGWRFVAPPDGWWVWIADRSLWAHRAGGVWQVGTVPAASLVVGGVQVVGAQRPGIAAPAGGAVADAQARAVLTSVLDALRAHGLIAN